MFLNELLKKFFFRLFFEVQVLWEWLGLGMESPDVRVLENFFWQNNGLRLTLDSLTCRDRRREEFIYGTVLLN